MKNASTSAWNMISAIGSYPPCATHALLKLPRQVCIDTTMSRGRPLSAPLIMLTYAEGSVAGSSPLARQFSRTFSSHRYEKVMSSICR